MQLPGRTTAMDALGVAFRLSEGEQSFLLGAEAGQGILLGGSERVAFSAQASEAEHALVTTDPAEVDDDNEDDPC